MSFPKPITPARKLRERQILSQYDLYNQLDKIKSEGIWNGTDHRIQLRVWNSNSLITKITMRIRIWYLNGNLEDSEFILNVTSNRAETIATFNPGVGWIQNIMVHAEPATPTQKTCFVVVRSFNLKNNAHMANLICTYIDAANHASFPYSPQVNSIDGNGRILTITGNNPAAGVEALETVPTNALWRLIGIVLPFVTDATVITRQVALEVRDGGVLVARYPAQTTQTASLTRNYLWGNYIVQYASDLSFIYIPSSIDMRMTSAVTIGTSTDNLQAGDNFGTSQLIMEEWLTPT